MKRLPAHLSLSLLFIFHSLIAAIASPPASRVDLFNIENGLSQTAVLCLLHDSYGFIWIGTQDGLNRFDGYGFTVFRNHPLDKTSLPNNYINSLCEDHNGNLWVGTWNGLSRYDRNQDIFINYFHSPENENSLSHNRIYYVFCDRQGVIWVKTIASLDRYDPETDSFVRYPHYSDIFTFSSENNDFDIFEDSQNRLWVGTKEGLMLFDRQIGLFKRYQHDPSKKNSLSSNRVKDIFEDAEGNIWVATNRGLNLLDFKNGSFTRFLHIPGDPHSLPDDALNTIFQDKQGTIWIGSEQGVCSFDPKKRIFSPQIFYHRGNELYATSITSFVEDNADILWVGSLMGLIKWDKKSQKFNLYDKYPDGTNIFSSNYVASLFEDEKGALWVGTWGTGLFHFDRKTLRTQKFSESSRDYNICNDYVHVIYRTVGNQLLIGTRNGVQRYVPENHSFVNLFGSLDQHFRILFNDNRVYDMLEDSKGNLWIATHVGLHCYNGKGITSYYHSPADSTSLSSNEIHALALDGKTLWVGTFNGLNRINLDNFEIQRYKESPRFSPGDLIANDIVSLMLSSNGVLWVGTSSGLQYYMPEQDAFALYTVSDGLPNNLINSMQEDRSGKIWVSTNWGLAAINPEDNTITPYGVNDGLQSYEFNTGASHKSKSGELFFGGIAGFNAFYPDSLKHNTTIPPIVISSFEIISFTGKKALPIQGKTEIVISENFSLINIEFAALDFTHPEKNCYKYEMEGLENEWVDLGTKRSASFSNLREGTYVFRVIGSNSDGVWNEEGVSLRIVVKVKFWKSKVAFVMYTFLLVASLIIFLRTRNKMLRKTNRLLKERESTMKEIELQKEELFLKNKSITDSIHYAKRIQEALIPTEAFFRSILPDSFILYMPKDIVSGDFYWINETKNKIFVAVIDCTGHGVPGAFMSIIGIELLRNLTINLGINNSAEILNRLDRGIHEIFSNDVDDYMTKVKDGMDVSFCVIDKELNTLQFAGAFNNLYLIRDSKLTEIKGDRFTVGVGGVQETPLFNSHSMDLKPDDMIYLFTDGYIDQFGGSEGKKFKFRRFRHLLLNIHKLPLEEQKKQLHETINDWRGAQEQVDDILIIGIKTDLSCFF